MPQDTKIILYKNFQIELKSKSLPDGKWQAEWWVWVSDEAIYFFDDQDKFDTQTEADLQAEVQAKAYVDKVS